MNELRDDIQDQVLPATPCATMNENKSHKRWSSQAMYVIICAHFHAPTNKRTSTKIVSAFQWCIDCKSK